jgi:uncharacterized protein (TIGR03382 family)
VTADPEVILEEIEETRSDLGRTVEALAAKADVKETARSALGSVGERIRERPAIAYAVAGLLLLWLLRRRR